MTRRRPRRQPNVSYALVLGGSLMISCAGIIAGLAELAR